MSHNDWDAQQYKKHSEPQKEGGKSIIQTYPFRGDEKVLDIGCGDGIANLTKKHTNLLTY